MMCMFGLLTYFCPHSLVNYDTNYCKVRNLECFLGAENLFHKSSDGEECRILVASKVVQFRL